MKKVRKIENTRPPKSDSIVTMKVCGNVIDLRYMLRKYRGCAIEKLDSEFYVVKRTGELKQFEHSESRADDIASARRSLMHVRDIINANATHPERIRWITLTYRENMRDEKRLYDDFKHFWQKFKYHYKKKGYKVEYISVAEPQGRGAWHLHLIVIFDRLAPFVPNEKVAEMWGQGFTSTKKVTNIDNLGAYLSAYLADMPLDEALAAGYAGGQVVNMDIADESGKKTSKAIVKGARLALYPRGFHICRHSRGIKVPKEFDTTEEKAQEIIGDAALVYERTTELYTDDGRLFNTINRRQYNRARKNYNNAADQIKKEKI